MCRVSGRITDRRTGAGVVGVHVEAFDRDVGGEQRLQATRTVENGRYEMTYRPEQFAEAEHRSADLIVRAFDDRGCILAASDIVYHAPAAVTIDLAITVDREATSDHARLLAAVVALSKDIAVVDLTDDQVTFLAGELEVERSQITLLRESARRAPAIGLPPEALYAFGTEGFDLDPKKLFERPVNALIAALEAAVRRGIVSAESVAGVAERLGVLSARHVDLASVVKSVKLRVPAEVAAALQRAGVASLAGLRAAGGVATIEPRLAEQPAARTLDALAVLSILPIDLQTSAGLVAAGYTHPVDVARTPAAAFVKSLDGRVESARAAVIHDAAIGQVRVLNNIITATRLGDGPPAVAQYAQNAATRSCNCEACINATGPLAYLADLLDYAVRHLRYRGNPISVSFLTGRFFQPFDRLPAACYWVEKRIRQARICIEVVRARLQSGAAPPAYLLAAYEQLLRLHGTSVDELRAVVNGPKRRRVELAARLAIRLTPKQAPTDEDEIDRLFMNGAYPGSEEALEELFGLRDTKRDPLDADVRPAILRWRMAYLEAQWQSVDLSTAPPPDARPLIDPDLIGLADIADSSPNASPNRAVDLWRNRQQVLAVNLAEMRQFVAGAQGGSLDLLLRNEDSTGHVLIPAFGLGKSIGELIDMADRAERADIGPEVDALGLSRRAFDAIIVILRLYRLDPATVSAAMLDTILAILIQRWKARDLYPAWRTEERTSRILLSGDHFRIGSVEIVPIVEWQPQPWRATMDARLAWEAVLRARIAQAQAVAAAVQQAVDRTESALLDSLCHYLLETLSLPGSITTDKLERFTQQLGIDVEAGICQKTTRVAQAIETIQGVLFGARNGLLEDPELVLDAPHFDQEWIWIGSIATWRAAMQVFLHPETALRPTLRRRQTKPFVELVTRLRRYGRLDPESAASEMRAYQDSFRDMCSLRRAGLAVTSALRTGDPFDSSSIPPSIFGQRLWFERGQVFAAARGGASGRLYFATWKQQPGWGLSGSPTQSLWDPIPGLETSGDVVSVLPHDGGSGESVAVFARASSVGAGGFVSTSYDGAAWSKPTRYARPPGMVCTAQYLSAPPVDPELPAGAPAPSWALQGDDQMVAADVDGDGRAEVIVLRAQAANGRRPLALFRPHGGGLVLAWSGSIDGNWALPDPQQPLLLTATDTTSILRPHPVRVLMTNAVQQSLGVLGWQDGQGLDILNAQSQITGGPGLTWNVRVPTPGQNSRVTFLGVRPVPDNGTVYFFETTPAAQRVGSMRWVSGGFGLLGLEPLPWARFTTGGLGGPGFRPVAILPSGVVVAVATNIVHRFDTNREWDDITIVYRGIRRDSSLNRLVDEFYYVKPGNAEHSYFDGVDGKAEAWELRTDDQFFPLFGTFQTRTLIFNPARRAIALLTDVRVVFRTDGQIDAEDGADGDVWPLHEGDTIVATFADEQSTPLIIITNAAQTRIGVITAARDRLRTRWMGSGTIARPTSQGVGWTFTRNARFAPGDVDMDRNPELVALASDGSGQRVQFGILHLIPGPISQGLLARIGTPSAFGLSNVPASIHTLDYPPRLSQTQLAERRRSTRVPYDSLLGSSEPHNQIYLDEVLYYAPLEIALRLSAGGYYPAALDWLRALYEYDRPGGPLPVVYRLELDGIGTPTFDRQSEWLRDPLDPHTIADTRLGSHQRFALLTVVRCLLQFADSEFTRATAESIPRARELYLEALELLRSPVLRPRLASCDDVVGTLQIAIGDYNEAWVWHQITRTLATLPTLSTVEDAVADVRAIMAGNSSLARKLTAAQDAVAAVAANGAKQQTLQALLDAQRAFERNAVNAAITDNTIVTAFETAATRGHYVFEHVPAPTFVICIPPNPAVEVARRHAEVNLRKIRSCRSIAGLEMSVEPYAISTVDPDDEESLWNLVRSTRPVLQPLPYRYITLMERARQLVEICQQIESSMLSALESADRATYDELRARQDLGLTQASVQLKDLQVTQAVDGVGSATIQRQRAQVQHDHYRNLLDLGLTPNEQAASYTMLASMAFSFISSSGGGAGGMGGVASGLSTMGQQTSTWASYERREMDWMLQEVLAEQDMRLGEQQVRIARDLVLIAGQERAIAGMQADYAKAMLDFIATKRFGNADLYDWMSGILEQIYRFFLQQATSIALLAEAQLAFERQEALPVFIQADYWEPPRMPPGDESDPIAAARAAIAAELGRTDRRGLTGSARLLRDLYALDQYAFRTAQRKLQLTKTFSLAQLDPFAFQRFRESGILRFATPLSMFDRDFPGHYLRLIHRVRVSVLALVPPTQGIRATLATTGPSRVVVAGNGDFPTVVVRRAPEAVALTSPRDATGLFDLDIQPEMMVPFEHLGVDGMWEFRLPKASNPIDYDTVGDVLLTMEYTALDSGDYRRQVMRRLDRRVIGDRPFSFRLDFADAWYDLHNPDQTPTPMAVRFETRRRDYPPNVEDLTIQHLILYFSRSDGATFEVPISNLVFAPRGAMTTVEAALTTVDGLISTRQPSGAAWLPANPPSAIGTWELVLPNTPEMRGRFSNNGILEMLLVVTYSGVGPEWQD